MLSQSTQVHVAEIDFSEFYAPAFGSPEETREFVTLVESAPSEQAEARTVLWQGAPMLWLGDRIEEVAQGRPALKILFLLIAAEAVSKLAFGSRQEGRSREFVHRFFEEICQERHRKCLARAFSYLRDSDFLTTSEAVDLLYDVRCDVVHAGRYFAFSLKTHALSSPLLTPCRDVHVVAHITIEELRQVVLEGIVQACRLMLVADTTSMANGDA